jgi:hypothetical protein
VKDPPLPQILVLVCAIKDHPKVSKDATLHYSVALRHLRPSRTTEDMRAWCASVQPTTESDTFLFGYGNSAEAATRDLLDRLEGRT